MYTLSFFLVISLCSVTFPGKSTWLMLPDRINFSAILQMAMRYVMSDVQYTQDTTTEENTVATYFQWQQQCNK